MAVPEKFVEGAARSRRFPGIRREPPAGVPARNRTAAGGDCPGGSQHRGFTQRQLHLFERAAGAALSDRGCAWVELPARESDRSRPVWTAGPRQYFDSHVVSDSYVASVARQMDFRESAGNAAAS